MPAFDFTAAPSWVATHCQLVGLSGSLLSYHLCLSLPKFYFKITWTELLHWHHCKKGQTQRFQKLRDLLWCWRSLIHYSQRWPTYFLVAQSSQFTDIKEKQGQLITDYKSENNQTPAAILSNMYIKISCIRSERRFGPLVLPLPATSSEHLGKNIKKRQLWRDVSQVTPPRSRNLQFMDLQS